MTNAQRHEIVLRLRKLEAITRHHIMPLQLGQEMRQHIAVIHQTLKEAHQNDYPRYVKP
jgi:hypothetical protein